MNVFNHYAILAIDDEKNALTMFKHQFKNLMTVLTAESAKEALAMLQTYKDKPIAAVIVDQRMPEMTGLELMLQIKEKFPDIVRVLFTGYSDAEVLQSIINQADIFKYIRKPYEEEPVKEILEKSIQKYIDDKEKKRQLNRTMALIQEKTCHAMENYTFWMAHHINNGLQAISTYIDLSLPGFAIDESKKDFAQTSRMYVRTIAQIVQTLKEIYSNSLADFVETPLSTLMQFEGAELKKLAEEKKVVIKEDCREPELVLMVNPMAVQEALRRLVVNSIEASSKGGVVEVSAAKFFDDGRDAVMFEVRDHGKGIEPEVKEKLFYPFLKLGSNTLQPKGLGLAYVQATVARHGGDIMVESNIGKGTTITFTLPIIQQQSEPEDPLDKQARELLKKRK